MKTYVCNGIIISIGATVVEVKEDGITQKFKEKIISKCNSLIKEFWHNNYFKRKTKSFLMVRSAEIITRCFHWGTVYLFLKEKFWPYIQPYLPQIVEAFHDWKFIFHLDIGFALGCFTVVFLRWLKFKLFEKRR
ncbi:MAG TPA: hypothetical protein VK190_04755 [Pseudoneobacillus sp.]|nr:hypothetical protein [Pseudoneobacillus sp.]